MWLADLFDDLGDLLARIAVTLISIGNWFKSYGYSSVLYNFFYTVGGYFVNTASKCFSIADELNDWWDTISQAVSDIGNLGTAISNAIAWVKGIPTEIRTYVSGAIDTVKAWVLTQIPDILAWVKGHALDLYNAIKGYIVDIAAWVSQHALDLYNAIKGYIVDAGAWFTGHISDIWDAIKGFVADAIAAQLALFAELYNWFEWYKEVVKSFFISPFDWLVDKFTDWFLGPEK